MNKENNWYKLSCEDCDYLEKARGIAGGEIKACNLPESKECPLKTVEESRENSEFPEDSRWHCNYCHEEFDIDDLIMGTCPSCGHENKK